MMLNNIRFQGLYRLQAPESSWDTAQRELHAIHRRSFPIETTDASRTIEYYLKNQAFYDTLDRPKDSPLIPPVGLLERATSFYFVKPATVEGKPGSQGFLATGKDFTDFLTTEYPDTFSETELQTAMTLAKTSCDGKLAADIPVGDGSITLLDLLMKIRRQIESVAEGQAGQLFRSKLAEYINARDKDLSGDPRRDVSICWESPSGQEA